MATKNVDLLTSTHFGDQTEPEPEQIKLGLRETEKINYSESREVFMFKKAARQLSSKQLTLETMKLFEKLRKAKDKNPILRAYIKGRLPRLGSGHLFSPSALKLLGKRKQSTKVSFSRPEVRDSNPQASVSYIDTFFE